MVTSIGVLPLEAGVVVEQPEPHGNPTFGRRLKLGVQRLALIARKDHRIGANRLTAMLGLLDPDLAARAEQPPGELRRIPFRQPFAEGVARAADWFGFDSGLSTGVLFIGQQPTPASYYRASDSRFATL